MNQEPRTKNQLLPTAVLFFISSLGLPWLWSACVLPARSRVVGDRIPASHSEDYWLAERMMLDARRQRQRVWLGDSVVWGAYAAPEDAWPAQTQIRESEDGPVLNLGLNGLHPIALQGMLNSAWRGLRGMQVTVHCNPLWMSSERRDCSSGSPDLQNHALLAPALWDLLPGDDRDISARMQTAVDRSSSLLLFGRHLRMSLFDNQSLARWTTEHPYRIPVAAPSSMLPKRESLYQAVPWEERPGMRLLDSPWVELRRSRQWAAFDSVLNTLHERGNHIRVVVGPLNTHMMTEGCRQRYLALVDQISRRLEQRGESFFVLEPVASDEYADASHPLAAGYRRLAEQLQQAEQQRRSNQE